MSTAKAIRVLGHLTKKASIFVLLSSFAISPLAPVIQVYAQEVDHQNSPSGSATINRDGGVSVSETVMSGDLDNPSKDVTAPEGSTGVISPTVDEEVPSPTEDPIVSPEEGSDRGLDPPAVNEISPEIVSDESVATTTESMPTGEKFKKDSKLSPEEELAAVRQHLLREGLPQVALDRLNAFEAERVVGPQGDGIMKRIWDFVTGNTEQAREQRAAEDLINSEPFKVDGFRGKINVASAERYERDFKEAKEQGSFIQKFQNFIKSGTFFNSDPANTQKDGGPLSWLFGASKAMADASNDPGDYMDAGDEILFSQEIQDTADALDNDPLKIFNFVRSGVEYIPYYGSKKGADGTLVERAGNDIDKSALLIALLRQSGIAARYRHVDAKLDITTVNNMLGVTTATSSAQLMSLNKIPYTLYTMGGQDAFFVVDHTYVEAYLPYGVSRGTDIGDGGDSQWVPMDPTVNTYIYSQPLDIGGGMRSDSFAIEDFFDNYLDGDYGTSTEPLDAYKTEVQNWLDNNPATSTDVLSFDDALTQVYSPTSDLEIIPGSLPFDISSDIGTYDFIPNSLRHTIEFTVTDGVNTVLNDTAYVSDLADREVLMTYDPSTIDDENIVNGFDTIYDVVPLSLVAVTPKLKVAGDVMFTGTATTTMGRSQKYKMEFTIPTRTMGGSVTPLIGDEMEKGITTGTTDAIAFNTDRVVPTLLRPTEDTETGGYTPGRRLYSTAVDYLFRLQNTDRELASILGGDFTHIATKASISNGVDVTTSMGQPYSFEWKGLRIDAASSVRYFNRLSASDRNYNRDEFMGIFGLQASQDESDIFEDNFDIVSVATVKGLKMVANGEFPGITLEKITDANEGDIDSLSISTSTKNAFHTAIGDGRTIYTPSDSISYEDWDGLFYIAVDFADGDATYAIGEGLNGGYSVTQWPNNLLNFWRYTRLITPGLTADITSPSNNSTYIRGASIPWVVNYNSATIDWTDRLNIDTKLFTPGNLLLWSGYGTNDSVNVKITKGTAASSVACVSSIGFVTLPDDEGAIGEEMHLPLRIDKASGVYQSRYNDFNQYNIQDNIHTHPTSNQFFTELKGTAMTSGNVNNPWIDPTTGKYWNMSIAYGAFNKPAKETDHEKYYMNMRWVYSGHGPDFFGKKVWIKNPATGKAVLAGILEYGPSPNLAHPKVAGASPEAMKQIGAHNDDNMEYCLAEDQDLPYGTTVNF